MTDIVDQTVKLWRSTRFEWGQADCMLSIGDYLARCGTLDVTGEFRGRYSDETGALAHMSAAGGPGALIERTGAQPVTDGPRRGDVVVIDVAGDGIGALCTGDMIAARTEHGVKEIAVRFVPIKGVWRVCT